MRTGFRSCLNLCNPMCGTPIPLPIWLNSDTGCRGHGVTKRLPAPPFPFTIYILMFGSNRVIPVDGQKWFHWPKWPPWPKWRVAPRWSPGWPKLPLVRRAIHRDCCRPLTCRVVVPRSSQHVCLLKLRRRTGGLSRCGHQLVMQMALQRPHTGCRCR